MLRLRIAKKLPWVDSKGEVRSPLEDFQLLDAEARLSIDHDDRRRWTAWEVGVLTDDWDAPEFSKPTTVGDEEGTSIAQTCFAIGSQMASDLQDELRPLWQSFLECVIPDTTLAIVTVSDEVWHDEGRWIEIGPALNEGLFGHVEIALTPTSIGGRYRLSPGTGTLNRLTAAWWPSAVGMLAGSVVGTPKNLEEVIEHDGNITPNSLDSLQHHFQTAASFDNAGFSILSSTGAWQEIETRLAARGWVDGRPLETMPPTV